MASATSTTSTLTREIQTEFPNLIRVYNDGTVERLFGSPIVPPSPSDPHTGVSSKDGVISDDPPISVRLYLPKPTHSNSQEKLPIFVYFHGGGFCLVSAFSFLNHRYLNLIASEANVIAVSLEYRLAPEHPLPAAFEDCWASLKWVCSHLTTNGDPWLTNHGDLTRLYIGGDSAGGTIVNNMALRCGAEDLPRGVKLLGGSSRAHISGDRNQSDLKRRKVANRVGRHCCGSWRTRRRREGSMILRSIRRLRELLAWGTLDARSCLCVFVEKMS